MEHAAVGVVLVAALEVVLGVHAHVACGHLNVLVVGYVNASRIVHLVVGTGGDGEAAHGALAVVEHGVDVWWEYALVGIVHLNGGVGPPQECLRQRSAVAHVALNLQISTAWAQRKAGCSLLMEHALHLIHPYGYRTILILHNFRIHGQIGRWAVVLWPVELDATAYPRSCQTHQGWFDDVVVIDEMTLLNLVVGHLHATAQLWQDHYLDVFVLHPDGFVLLIHLLVGNALDDWIRIDHAARTLIHAFLKEDRVLLGLSSLVGGNHHLFFPCFC